MFCPKCGAVLSDDASFCSSCGSTVVSVGTPVAPTVYNQVNPNLDPSSYAFFLAEKKRKTRNILLAVFIPLGIIIIALIIGFALPQADGGSHKPDAIFHTQPLLPDETGIDPEPVAEPSEYEKLIQNAVANRTGYSFDIADEYMQIKSVTLYEDGTVAFALSEDLADRYGDNVKICENAVFAESFVYGNGGWNTIIMLMEDGTVSAINADKLYMDREIQLITNLGNLKEIVSVDNELTDDGFAWQIIARDYDGNEYALDEYLY